MNGMKQMLHQQLIANVIKDRCANAPGIIFDESLCSQHRCIRFRSERLAAKSISATYEVFIYSDRLEICLGSESWELRGNIPQALLEQFDDFLKALPSIEEKLIEGAQKSLCTNRYERSRKARQKCLAYHGYSCKVCGMNFETFYGIAFKEIIEVHHIVPISQIGEEYAIDPIKDLVPVCPNCHAALHSKEDGTYTLEELRKMIDVT
jgi:predicted HNH restriction endonuclease